MTSLLPASLRDWILCGHAPRPADEEGAAVWVSAAAEQGLARLLASAVRAEPSAWPPRAQERLRNLYALRLRNAVCQGDAARRMWETLSRQGIRTLPLKGAAVNTRLYDSPAERPMVDVDLRVLDRFLEALGAWVRRARFRGQFRGSGISADSAEPMATGLEWGDDAAEPRCGGSIALSAHTSCGHVSVSARTVVLACCWSVACRTWAGVCQPARSARQVSS